MRLFFMVMALIATLAPLCAQTSDTLRTDSLFVPAMDSVPTANELLLEDYSEDFATADTILDATPTSLSAPEVVWTDLNVDDYDYTPFNPIPARAVWYAALFPGAGQIYNRKYWKLPIIYGGFLGLLYGYQWNNRYYKTYSNAYRDLVLGSPNASYRDFLPPNYDVAARYDYLERVFKRKKNSYRNYRDYCVVGMIGVYLVAMVDAYVDASLYHFDVSPDLGMNGEPVIRLGYSYSF